MMSQHDQGQGFAALFESASSTSQQRKPKVGQEVTGTVVAIGAESVFIDLGAKCEGMLDRNELVDDDGKLTVSVGSSVTARVVDTSNDNIVLRQRMGRQDGGAEALANAYQHAIPVMGKVVGVNKGGVEVQLPGDVRAFCPISQLDNNYVEDSNAFVGRELEFRITKLQQDRGRTDVVLSRKVLLMEARAKMADELRATLKVGLTIDGTVTTVKDYGAFVDIGGIEGMLHKSEMGFGRVAHPRDILQPGASVKVQIIKIEPSDQPKRPDRISLSLKSLMEDPWKATAGVMKEGAATKGKVVKLEPFGAFVEIADGVEGLVHISEISDRRLNHPREALSVGDEVEVVVLASDGERRRLSLSIKGVAAQQERAHAAGYRPARGGSLGTFADLMNEKRGK